MRLTRLNISYAGLLFIFTIAAYYLHVVSNYIVAGSLVVAALVFTFVNKSIRSQTKFVVLAGLCFTVVYLINLHVQILTWPFDFYIASLVGFVCIRFLFRQRLQKLKWSFRFSKKEWISVAVINIPAVLILLWYFQHHSEVAKTWPLPDLPLWAIPLAVGSIAVVNGLREELFYRGLLQPISAEQAPVWYVVSIQAVLFGFLHFANSFPQGWLGVALTAVWGASIAIQYSLFRSIALAWVTHAIADAIMFSVIIVSR